MQQSRKEETPCKCAINYHNARFLQWLGIFHPLLSERLHRVRPFCGTGMQSRNRPQIVRSGCSAEQSRCMSRRHCILGSDEGLSIRRMPLVVGVW
jgi:hypothetical protein